MGITPLNQDDVWEKPQGFKRWLGHTLLEAMGWRMEGEGPRDSKFVLIAAPHTSNWDLPLMLAMSYISGYKLSWLGKHTLFQGPLRRHFFTWLGGLPVDRTAPQGLVQQVVDAFEQSDSLIVAIPPEGKRRKVSGWKTGFYYIAHGAQVPLVLGYLDYRTRVGGFGPRFETTGDIEADFEVFREFYGEMEGKFPAWTSEVCVRTKRRYESAPPKPLGRVGRRLGALGSRASAAVVALAVSRPPDA